MNDSILSEIVEDINKVKYKLLNIQDESSE